MNITVLIIIITCGISFWAWQNDKIFNYLTFNPYNIYNKREWYRFFSCALLHADFTHLLINMFVLYSFGQFIEQVYKNYITGGIWMYPVLYILSVAISNIKTYFQYKNNSWYNAVGASGAVSAVVFAFILVAPAEKILLFAIIPIPAFIYGLMYLAYSQYMAKNSNDNIGHDAHFYGAIFGFIFTGLLQPQLFLSFVTQIINR